MNTTINIWEQKVCIPDTNMKSQLFFFMLLPFVMHTNKVQYRRILMEPHRFEMLEEERGSILDEDRTRHHEGRMRHHDMIEPPPTIDWVKPPATTDWMKPHPSSNSELDLAFIMDTTGSMSSYIRTARQNIWEIVERIVESSQSDVRLALIEYRDHWLEDETFVTRKHDFTSSVSGMKSWLNDANAEGGGDRPEAVADAMYQANKLSWRQSATKISVMVSDAPPHGLVPSEDNSYPGGSPNGHDPMQIASDLAQNGVTLYVIGCEPAIVPYKDFFMALAYLTGGQYVPLSEPTMLVTAIIGGVREEISLKKFESDVQQEIRKASFDGRPINKQNITENVYRKLETTGAKSMHLVQNGKALEGPSASAKSLAKLTSMAEVRLQFTKGDSSVGSFGGRKPFIRPVGGIRPPSMPFGERRPTFPTLGLSGGVPFTGTGSLGRKAFEESFDDPRLLDETHISSSSSDTLETVEYGITREQIDRMVEKEFSKL